MLAIKGCDREFSTTGVLKMWKILSQVENLSISRQNHPHIVENFISTNGTHTIKNSFVDSSSTGLVGYINTNSSSENVVTIEENAFLNCTKLEKIDDKDKLFCISTNKFVSIVKAISNIKE